MSALPLEPSPPPDLRLVEPLPPNTPVDPGGLIRQPFREWDAVTFRIRNPPQRPAALRKSEARSWTGAAPELPPPAQWGAAITRAALEGLLGMRPVSELVRWLDEPIYQALSRRAGLAMRVLGPQRARLVRVRSANATLIDQHAAEVSVVLHDGTRHRAAALRLECYHGRWQVTALEIG